MSPTANVDHHLPLLTSVVANANKGLVPLVKMPINVNTYSKVFFKEKSEKTSAVSFLQISTSSLMHREEEIQ